MNRLEAVRRIALCSQGKAVRVSADGKVFEIAAVTTPAAKTPEPETVRTVEPIATPDIPTLLVMQHLVEEISRSTERVEAMAETINSQMKTLKDLQTEFIREMRRPLAPKYDKAGKLLGVQRVDSI